ncbi:MAG: hypothetical protein WD448_05860 [Woeseia sp.]
MQHPITWHFIPPLSGGLLPDSILEMNVEGHRVIRIPTVPGGANPPQVDWLAAGLLSR